MWLLCIIPILPTTRCAFWWVIIYLCSVRTKKGNWNFIFQKFIPCWLGTNRNMLVFLSPKLQSSRGLWSGQLAATCCFACIITENSFAFSPYAIRNSVETTQQSIFLLRARLRGFDARVPSRTVHGRLYSGSRTGGTSLVEAGGSLWMTTSWNQATSASSTWWQTQSSWRWTSTLSDSERGRLLD